MLDAARLTLVRSRSGKLTDGERRLIHTVHFAIPDTKSLYV